MLSLKATKCYPRSTNLKFGRFVMKYLAAFVIGVGRAEEPDGGSLGRRYRSRAKWGRAVTKYTGKRKP